MVGSAEQQGTKVPEVTLVFWIIKIAATTLGETFGDTVTMTLNWGYLVGTAIFFLLLIALVAWQIAANRFHPFLYWATIIASTTAGTTMADFADRSLGLDYAAGRPFCWSASSPCLPSLYLSLGSISVATIRRRSRNFLLAAITFSQTLGTALGDWMADDTRLGYEGVALVFGVALALVAGVYFWTNVSRVPFLGAFILTRPLGPTVRRSPRQTRQRRRIGAKPPDRFGGHRGFYHRLSVVLPQRPGRHPGRSESTR